MPELPVMTLTMVAVACFLIFIGAPMAMALGLSAVIVVYWFEPVQNPQIIPRLLSEASTSFVLICVPLFILAGNLMSRGTVGRNLIDFTTSIVGWMPGGLGAVNIVGSMLFGGISGSSLADTATFGSILVPRMMDDGYPKDYAGAVTLTSSTLSVIIPPSLLIVLAAATTEQSVGRALAGGLVPGVLLTALLLIPNHVICKRHNYGTHIPFSRANVWSRLKTCWTAILAPIIVLGSIFSGFVTPTEGAGLAVFYVLLIDFVLFRQLGLRDVWISLREAGVLTAAILFIATSSAVANWIVAFEHIPDFMAAILLNLPGGKYGFMAAVIVMVVLIGMVVDATPAILIFAPLFLPIALKMGIDPTHFLVTVVVGLALGLTTPPYGVCLFSISAVCGIPMDKLIRSSLSFYVFLFAAFILVAFIPEISLLFPNLIGL
ncbi:MAG: TRAP transporter large permease [Planctomycetota bacterium]|jgi:tripartite ATP-independent transporter DctM subunit|nr:TRAP transporter large permease [Planctomycetota bacterium]